MKKIRDFFAISKQKIILTIILLILMFLLFIGIFIFGLPIANYIPLLKFLALPFSIALIFNNAFIIFIGLIPITLLTILWNYIIANLLIKIINNVFSLKWNNKRISILILVLIIGVLVLGYFNLGWSDIFLPTADDSLATPDGISSIVRSNNEFSIRLYSQLKENSNENLFFSPWSIMNSVIMAYEGSLSDTREQIHSVFDFYDNEDERRGSFAYLLNKMNRVRGAYDLYNINAIWADKKTEIKTDYELSMKNYYIGQVRNLDMTSDPFGSSNQINKWVSKNTRGKITNIVSPQSFTPNTGFIITNAIYFKGNWDQKFDKKNTKPEDFILDSGNKIKVDMMRLTDAEKNFRYVESDDIQVLEMDYKGDKISMLILLPRTNINYLESIISEKKIREWRSEMKSREVHIYLPKYSFRTEYDLNNHFRSLGISAMFDPNKANFSIITDEPAYVDSILHKAYIDVYEEGTEAAAATQISFMMGTAFPSYIEFRVDKPFMFIIQEKETGLILFIGRVMNPNS